MTERRDEPAPGPLETCTDAELMDELERRFQSYLLVYCKPADNDDADCDDDVFYSYSGGTLAAIGLSVIAADRVKAEILDPGGG